MKVQVKTDFKMSVISMRNLQNRKVKNARINLEVGYAAPYAVYVHENLEIVHPNGQAKYLEIPLRARQTIMVQEMLEMVRGKYTLEEAMVVQGEKILAESRPLVPVRTGALRDSGYVSVTHTV